MSQIRLTDSERLSALARFGYSAREADFLCRAALHGGYFLRRQCANFLGRTGSGAAALLIEKVLRLDHAQATTYAAGQHIYHLCARPFYAVIGQEDNRNRRLRQPMTIKNKLMGFDFVLDHPDEHYLATEQEKLDYFSGTLALDRQSLPAKHYASQGQIVKRYFVEKFPLFLSQSQSPAASPVVCFCFVDEGCANVSGFQTFLHRYMPLFKQLREYRVVYVAATDARFEQAQSLWQRFAEGVSQPGAVMPSGAELARMVEHFEARLLMEARDWASFDRAKLIWFREGEREFAGERYAALYRRWLAGAGRAEAILNPDNAAGPRGKGTFQTFRLEQNYALFGSAREY